jgi:hypothetical protein
MMRDLGPLLNSAKRNDILARLRDRKPEQALGAEMELGLLWGIQQAADLEIEPTLPDGARPEAFSAQLFGKPAYIEITTLSDGKLSGEENMHRAVHRIVTFANTVSRGCGRYLFFTFTGISSWDNNSYRRNHSVASDFNLDQPLKDEISSWLRGSAESRKSPLLLHNETIDVRVEFRSRPQKTGFNFFSSLPSLAYDIEDNPLFARLKEKASRQLSAVPNGALKVIFIVDGGSRLLRLVDDKDYAQRLYKSGAEIIEYFLSKSSTHVVCVFSPAKETEFFLYPSMGTKLYWRVSLFCRDNCAIDDTKLRHLAEVLPAPKWEGYQARSLQKQNFFDSSGKAGYLGTRMEIKTATKNVKISARLMLDYLAGKVSHQQFEREFPYDEKFGRWMEQGYSVKNVTFESGGIDEDDDYVVFDLAFDPAGLLFKEKKNS